MNTDENYKILREVENLSKSYSREIKNIHGNYKGVKLTLVTIGFTILLQVGGFLFYYGRLTEKVENHDKMITRICDKLDRITVIGVAEAANLK